RADPRRRAERRHPPARRGAQCGAPGRRTLWTGGRGDLADPARHALHGPIHDLQGLCPGDHRRAGQHSRRRRGGDRARPGRELDRRFLRDRLAGGGGVRDHDRRAVPAARRPVQARRDEGRMKLAVALAGALAFAALPLITSSNYIVGVGISALIFTVAAAALNLVYGFTGLLSFAQLGFWGLGGYTTTLTVMTFGDSFWMGVLYAALLNAALALVIGYPILRTNRHAFV